MRQLLFAFVLVNVGSVPFLVCLIDTSIYLVKPQLPRGHEYCSLNPLEHSEEPGRKQMGEL